MQSEEHEIPSAISNMPEDPELEHAISDMQSEEHEIPAAISNMQRGLLAPLEEDHQSAHGEDPVFGTRVAKRVRHLILEHDSALREEVTQLRGIFSFLKKTALPTLADQLRTEFATDLENLRSDLERQLKSEIGDLARTLEADLGIVKNSLQVQMEEQRKQERLFVNGDLERRFGESRRAWEVTVARAEEKQGNALAALADATTKAAKKQVECFRTDIASTKNTALAVDKLRTDLDEVSQMARATKASLQKVEEDMQKKTSEVSLGAGVVRGSVGTTNGLRSYSQSSMRFKRSCASRSKRLRLTFSPQDSILSIIFRCHGRLFPFFGQK